MLNRRDFLLATSAAAFVPKAGLAQADADRKLDGLFSVFVEEDLHHRPESATQLGLDKGTNAGLRSQLTDNSAEGIAKARALNADQLRRLGGRFPVLELDSEQDAPTAAFMDTAAIMQSLDLVVTVDSSVAHLAGALNRPVWVALKQVPDWRWFLGRDDSPWYPSMKLFRQKRAGDWHSVFGEMELQVPR